MSATTKTKKLNGTTTKNAKKQSQKRKNLMDLYREMEKKPLIRVLDEKAVYSL